MSPRDYLEPALAGTGFSAVGNVLVGDDQSTGAEKWDGTEAVPPRQAGLLDAARILAGALLRKWWWKLLNGNELETICCGIAFPGDRRAGSPSRSFWAGSSEMCP